LPPASSSAKKANTMSRFGLVPVRAMSRATDRIMASMSFMSTAPRPQIRPSFSSPLKGSTCQSSFCAGTTSKCPWTTSASAEGSSPAIRVTTEARPGEDSKISVDRPTSSSKPAAYSAAARSPGPALSPKLEVSIRISSWQMRTTSSCGRRAGIVGLLADGGAWLQPIDLLAWRQPDVMERHRNGVGKSPIQHFGQNVLEFFSLLSKESVRRN
jgi:hypothetical protein